MKCKLCDLEVEKTYTKPRIYCEFHKLEMIKQAKKKYVKKQKKCACGELINLQSNRCKPCNYQYIAIKNILRSKDGLM